MNLETIREAGRQTAVIGDYDTVVIGSGMAGLSAAVAASRNGASTCLIDKQYGPGGLATLGNVTMWLPLCDGKGRQVTSGLAEELLRLSVEELSSDNTDAGFRGIPECWKPGGDIEERRNKRFQVDFNPSSYQLALERLIVDSGITLMYDTRFCGVQKNGDRISCVILENKDGRSAITGRIFIDASGDADLCAAAGEETVSADSNVAAGWYYTFSSGCLRRNLFTNAYSPTADRKGAKGPFFRGDLASEVTAQVVTSRRMMHERVAEQRKLNPDEDIQLIMPPSIPCFRMTRRLSGQFTVSEVHRHAWLDDAIGVIGDWRHRGPVYPVPFGCMRAKATPNLLAAGRCVSSDSSVWDVFRVFAPCVVTGEAAGTAAALLTANGKSSVDDLNIEVLQNRLREQGGLIDPALTAEKG